ncbi:hypothetical protein C8J57DRAFT_1728677 [Mycena rebaudengoi]|nr:hypothetical protein C8J57DRAFT_1728677 [Mycena rebaudengoi]
MEPYLQVEFADILTLSPAEQRAGLERIREEISIGKSDIALLEKQQREEIARLEERHQGERALLDAKQRDLEEKEREWEAALNRIVFPVLTIPPEIPSPTTAPLLVSQICRHWRHIALETSELWASVYLSAKTRQNASEFLEAWLRRAKGFPLSLHLHPKSTLIPSPVSFLATYSAQLHSLCITLSLTDIQNLLRLRPRLPILRKLDIDTEGELGDDVVIFEDLLALLVLRIAGTISTSNLGTYPTLTKLVICVYISVTELHDVLRACPHLLELSANFAWEDNSHLDVATHNTLEIFDICNEAGFRILDSLILPSLRKLTIPPCLKVETLIHFLERSSCPLRSLEVSTGFILEEWQQCLNLLPCLESLVFDGPSTFFAEATSPLVVPLLSDLKVTTEDNDIDYSSVVEFLTSRRDTFHSLEINVEFNPKGYECYNCCRRATPNVARIAALVKHGAEISVVDKAGFPIQWIYLAKRVK